MKNLLTTIALIIVNLGYTVCAAILPKSNDTLQFKIQNDTPHKFKIIKDGRTIFQNKFLRRSFFDYMKVDR